MRESVICADHLEYDQCAAVWTVAEVVLLSVQTGYSYWLMV